jgi:AraC-like DNA-binding protein
VRLAPPYLRTERSRPPSPGRPRHGEDSAEFVRAPPMRALRGQILGYCGYRMDLPHPRQRLEVASGTVTLVFGFNEPLRLSNPTARDPAQELTSLVGGARTTAMLGEHSGRISGVEAIMTPMAAFSILAMPLVGLAEQLLDLGAVIDDSGELVERLAERPDWRSRFALLDEAFATRLAVGPQCHPEVTRAWARLWEPTGRVLVPELASDTGWSRRHLERRFRQQIGLPPGAVAQVARLQRAIRLQDSGLPWARIAADVGFYDQSHLDRVWRNMIGCTPQEFRRHRVSSRQARLTDRVPGQATSVILRSDDDNAS